MRTFLSSLSLKRAIILVLLALMYVLVIFSVVELIGTVWGALTTAPYLLQTGELVDLLGQFLLVLVAIELLDTVQVYLSDDEVHAEVVIEAAIIAVARKAILLDLKSTQPLSVIGLALLIIALASGYYVLRLSHGRVARHHPGREQPPED
jgi:uncharacterized membrane protein (DUF373 family)